MTRLTRAEVIERIAAELGDAPCLICALLEARPLVIAETPAALALLPRYGLAEGHAMVALRGHITRFSDLDEAPWLEACRLARATARAIEATLAPVRCYVASLGTPREGLPMTSPHLHLHVVPVTDPDARPSEVLTWEHGVHWLDDERGPALRDRLRAALGQQAPW